MPMLARLTLAVAAAFIAAWFGVLLVDTHRVDEAAASSGSIRAVARVLTGPQRQFDARINDLRSARFLNPDTSIDLDIAGAYVVRGGAANLARAARTVDAVLGSEPEDLDAWASLYRIGQARHDPAEQQLALVHARQLDPRDFSTSR